MRLLLMMMGLVAAPVAALDYSSPESWLCRPDATGPCDTDMSLSEISPGGIRPLPAPPPAIAAIDCFYVYPTVSRQPTGNADGTLTDDERYVVQQQFARYGEVCRRFAPLYRQTTIASVSGAAKGDTALAYADVKAAWNHYLANDNRGRGVILIGHSQGARHLKRLIAEEISGKPVQRQLVAAHVIGFNIAVPQGAVAGGDLGQVPLCASGAETGCAIAYVTFAEAFPPPRTARFGRAGPGMRIACTNPSALLGAPSLTGIFPSRPRPAGSAQLALRLTDEQPATASYRLTGLVTARCVEAGNASYLAVQSPVPRIAQAFERMDSALPGWGLHLIDMNIALGDLIELARRQSAAWLGKNAR
ncbi:MAG: DUF3089 domain-containing protein [Sandarakinorhabdus sp.]|nr:DUF3089 domain-containing protein [Sandarakinorhabdus sp.]